MYLIISLDLHCFVQLVTGSPYLTSSAINLEFANYEEIIGVYVHTCTNTIVFSTTINFETLKVELNVFISEMTFTMFCLPLLWTVN